jgi:3-oxoacyl-[acyl-carrier protein] reductase
MLHSVVAGNQAFLDMFINLSPKKRIGKPEEIASVISFLVGPDSTWVSGQAIDVNGAGAV